MTTHITIGGAGCPWTGCESTEVTDGHPPSLNAATSFPDHGKVPALHACSSRRNSESGLGRWVKADNQTM